ncbi:unnamed protein product [Strongylus vulgaris]|uniref:Uncharacterized protein n=1 Tax=Strongylus vulgaris TaxID=40348 RepID=A0A3P7IIT6_STRVU|nr:unnamed protein product [Strongylus vulgaris]
MKEESTGCQGQLPGAWFYEMGDDASASPTFDLEEMGPFRGILSSRNCSESVEVPSSEHVAEIVGRQEDRWRVRSNVSYDIRNKYLRGQMVGNSICDVDEAGGGMGLRYVTDHPLTISITVGGLIFIHI